MKKYTTLFQIMIVISFTIVWSNFVIDNPNIYIIIQGIIVPFILLIGILQYKSKLLYLAVVVMFSFMLFRNILSSIDYYELSLVDNYESFCSCCPICELKSNLQMIALSMLAIFLMLTKDMKDIYLKDESQKTI